MYYGLNLRTLMLFRILFLLPFIYSTANAMAPRINWEKSIDKAIIRYGLSKEPDLKKLFDNAGIDYPPVKIALLAFKKERYIELWASDNIHKSKFIHKYPLTAYSGNLGPKLREHDLQIPEGIYQLVSFNPFSSMHLSMMINYPNHFDKYYAKKEGRRKMGDNIFLHGKSESVGCLAIGNTAIDQLFLLVRRVGLKNAKVIISPNDIRKHRVATDLTKQPRWIKKLYASIKSELHNYS